MTNGPRGNDPDSSTAGGRHGYGWLYGGKDSGPAEAQASGGPASSRPAAGPHDPEPTQVLPTIKRPGSSGSPMSAGAGGGVVTPRPAPTPPGRPRRRAPWWRILRLVLFAWLVFLVAVPLWAWARLDKVDAEPSGARPDNQSGSNYLLVGSDSRGDLTKKQRKRFGTGNASGQRTDTIMLLHTGSGPNVLLSIPRDSIVDIPGHGTTKVNAAFAYGGAQLLVKTIEQNTGIYIDNYVEIGFAGLVDIVDAVGGVTICPKTRMDDPLANLHIKKGCQEVQGVKALGYARSRHTSGLGDIDRARHQREVVSAIGAKATSPWTVLNPLRYFNLAKAGSDSLAVGKQTGPIDTLRFAWAMTRVDGKNGLTCSMPIVDLAVNWDPVRSKRLFRLIQEDRAGDIKKRLCGPSGLKG